MIMTSDNPRTEDPHDIIRQVEAGVTALPESRRAPYHVIPDRREAIATAVSQAKNGDMVLIAGKGHEDYQIVGTTRLHFDDREVAREAISKKVKAKG